jgi:hypothetical protein
MEKCHKAKVNLMPETLYVKHSQNGHAHLDPSLPVQMLPEDTSLVEMMGKDLLLEIWMASSESLKAKQAGALKCLSTSSSSMGSPWKSFELPTLESL